MCVATVAPGDLHLESGILARQAGVTPESAAQLLARVLDDKSSGVEVTFKFGDPRTSAPASLSRDWFVALAQAWNARQPAATPQIVEPEE